MRRFLMLCLLTMPVAAAQSPVGNLAAYDEWNKCVDSLKEEGDFDTGLWPRLRDSLRHDPPELVKSLDRMAMYDELIALHEKRIAALKKMRQLEAK